MLPRNLALKGCSLLFSLASALSPLRAGDTGDLGLVASDTPQTVSIVFKIRNQQDLERFISQSVDPSSRHFRDFMNTEEFADRYAPLPWDFFHVLEYIKKQGITVNEIMDNRMVIRATGTTAQFNALLNTELHEYSEHGHRFHRPSKNLQVPEEIKDIVLTVMGLDTQPAVRSHSIDINQIITPDMMGNPLPLAVPSAQAAATGVPGNLTVADVANLYNINPLYHQRINGGGQTLGIATMATFDPADAYAYWNALGLNVDPHRIQVIPIDGGAGSDPIGVSETTLDVEQAGGLAYRSKILVYEAPNTSSGFLDLFYRAVSDNRVDTLSVSWGLTEFFYDETTRQAYHQAFLEAAAQGIPVFAASGDAGAFDVTRYYSAPYFSPLNSVDFPASDPYITAAGGTTLPTSLSIFGSNVVVPQERPWGWNYLENAVVQSQGQFVYDTQFFPVGGGGGVSSFFPVPTWQAGIPGAQATPSDFSTWTYYPSYPDTSGSQFWGTLPSGFAGRNVPDVSLNADPLTGYQIYLDGSFRAFGGGTSFVAPQLNGIASLLTQATGGRLGFLNPQLYRLFAKHGYGPRSPFRAITTGDNLYWQAGPHYNPASGLGTLDVSILASELGHGRR